MKLTKCLFSNCDNKQYILDDGIKTACGHKNINLFF